MTNPTPKLLAQLEALLFIYGEALTYKKIAGILRVKEAEVAAGIKALEAELARENRGLMLITGNYEAQLTTKGDFKNIAEEIIKEELNATLTPAALETMSIVAYTGPISRAELDYIRGVNSTFILRSLLIRGLIERAPDPKRANAFVYTASFALFRHLGIGKQEELPEYKKFQDLVKQLRRSNEQSA